jgi:hypothetical protein
MDSRRAHMQPFLAAIGQENVTATSLANVVSARSNIKERTRPAGRAEIRRVAALTQTVSG